MLQEAESSVVNEDAAVLTAPDFIATNDRVAPRSNLNAAVQVIEDVVVLQATVAVVVEVDADLLARVDSVPSQNRRGSCNNSRKISI